MILVKLLLAHLLGDFILQPKAWVTVKEQRKLRSWQLYVHTLIHFVLINLLVWDLRFIGWAALLAVLHLVTDIIKVWLQKETTKRTWFFADQGIHLVVLTSVWAVSQDIRPDFSAMPTENLLILLTCLYALTLPVSVVIRTVISKWTPGTESGKPESLENAGNMIGILERILVFIFVVSGRWEAVGFLLAAKSVFRFGDLKDAHDRKLTEYVLIGTLLSFGIAIVLGMVYGKVMSNE